MRVMGMLPAYPPGLCVGSWMMTHQLIRALVQDGHHADVVLTSATGTPYVHDGVHVWPQRDKTDPFTFLGDADVIITHAESAERAIILGQLHGVPVIRLVHNTSVYTEAALRRHRAALTVYNSEHMARRYAGLADWSVVIRPPVDAGEYRTTPGDAVTLVNLSPDKGADLFYRLAERLPTRRFLGVMGGYGAQVLPHADDDLPNVSVLAHTPGDRMREEVYARTRVLLMPSLHESWGRVAVEAMASGIPVIAHPTPGLLECLADAGTFADRDDVDAWETALRTLLDGRRNKPAIAAAIARAGELDPAEDLATWRRVVALVGGRRVRVRSARVSV